MTPFSVRALISACRFSSQLRMYSLFLTRSGRPVKMMVRTLSSKPAVRTASWCAWEAPASLDRTNRVPTQTAEAPSIRALARDCPLNIPPAAISCTGLPVNFEGGASAKILATAGISTLVGISPCINVSLAVEQSQSRGRILTVWPPPSPPWAQIKSASRSRHFFTCLT